MFAQITAKNVGVFLRQCRMVRYHHFKANNLKFVQPAFFLTLLQVVLSTPVEDFVDNCNYKNKNWLQFLSIVKSDVSKQQISKFYPQNQRTEASDHIYFSQRPFINVKAIFCA